MTDSVSLGGQFEKLPKIELTKVGDFVDHYISAVKEVQQKDPVSKIAKFWAPKYMGKNRPVGQDEMVPGKESEYRPVMDIVLELDEKFSAYCTGDLLKKLKAAAGEVGNSIDVGARVGIRLDDLIQGPVGSPKKIHTVKYVPPVPSVKL